MKGKNNCQSKWIKINLLNCKNKAAKTCSECQSAYFSSRGVSTYVAYIFSLRDIINSIYPLVRLESENKNKVEE